MSANEVWDWTRSIFSLLGPAIGLPGLIALLLSRKQANKKLDLDEKGSDVTEFQALNQVSASIVSQARQAMLDAQAAATAAQKGAASAKAATAKYQSERDEFKVLMERVVDSLRKMRDLFTSYADRTGVPLTEGEKAIFEDTIDPRTLPGRGRGRTRKR